VGIKHTFVSTKDQGTDNTLVSKNEWNDDHDLSGVDILDIPTTESGTGLVLAPDGSGGVEFRTEGGVIDGNGVLALTYGTPPTTGVSGKVLLYANYMPATQVIPRMTSNTNPSGTVSYSSQYGSYPGWHAFDDNQTSGWLTNGGGVPCYLGYQFDSAQTIVAYKLKAWNLIGETNRQITTWTLEGSNNGTDWTTLDTVTGYTWATITEYYSFTVDSPGSYTYYKIAITANFGGDAYTGIGGVYMYPIGTVVGLYAMASDDSITMVSQF